MRFPQATLIDRKYPAYLTQGATEMPSARSQVKNKAQNLHLCCIDYSYTWEIDSVTGKALSVDRKEPRAHAPLCFFTKAERMYKIIIKFIHVGSSPH